MFLKPFRVKTQTSIKGSDRRKLRTELAAQYGLDEAMLREIIPNKDEMTTAKLSTHSGDTVLVYTVMGNPIFFELGDQHYYPTVYTLWKYPDLLPTFTTWPPVFSKIQKGADLMLPGVIVIGPVTPTTFGQLEKGTPSAIKLNGNKAPVAVGKAALSASDMYESAMRGKGVNVLHFYTDQLWEFGKKTHPPVLEDSEIADSDASDASDNDDEIEGAEGSGDSAQSHSRVQAVVDGLDELSVQDGAKAEGQGVSTTKDEEVESDEDDDPRSQQEIMDDLLVWCFRCALKTRVKKSDLPLLTSSFFRNHLQPCCPQGKFVDVKKSSHKKLSKFLRSMQDQGYIRVKELSKGVESIVDVTKDHSELRAFVVPDPVDLPEEAAGAASASEDLAVPTVTEMFLVNAAASAFFKQCGHCKGNALTAPDVRTALTNYVKDNELATDKKGNVTLDPILSDLVLAKGEYLETLRWEELISRTTDRMGPGYSLTVPGRPPVVKKGKLQQIALNVAQRGGNKKVTLIQNLEVYGINPQDFAHQIQISIACSTSVSQLPGKAQGSEVLIQGNQINFISNLLIDKYKIPRKYLSGLEKAPKTGKKKR